MITLHEPRDGRDALASACDALLEVLAEHHKSLRTLLALCDRKLAALRAADTAGLHALADEEASAVEAIAARDARREAVLARLAQLVPAAAARPPRLAALAAALPEPFSSRILAKSMGLRELAEKLQRKNGIAAAVARGLQTHIRAVFAEASSANCETVAYGRDGKADERVNRNWVDAVG